MNKIFTKRQLEIMHLVVQGKLNKEIAQHFDISTETVKKHTKNIYGRIGARNRAEAIRFYNERNNKI